MSPALSCWVQTLGELHHMALTHSPRKQYGWKIPFSFKDAAPIPWMSKQSQLHWALPSLISFRHESSFLLPSAFPDIVINVPSCRRNTDREVKPLPGESWTSKEELISPCLRNLVKASEQVLLEIWNNLYKHVLSYVTAELITPPWVTTPFYIISLSPKCITTWHCLPDETL